MGKRKSYAEEEMNLSDQSKAFVDYLTSRGVLSDQKISDKNIREKKKELAKKAYHNTLLLLKHYRDIIWAMNCIIPDKQRGDRRCIWGGFWRTVR